MLSRLRRPGLLVALVLATIVSAPLLATAADELVIQFRSTDDPDVTPDLTVCAAAPFVPNVVAGASLWSFQTRGKDGMVVNLASRRIGEGTACIQVLDFTFTPFGTARLFSALSVGGLDLLVDGVCTVTSNDVPLAGVILAGCSLDVVAPPPGFVGGVSTSNSVFNPFGLPGFNTGSFWTLRLFRE